MSSSARMIEPSSVSEPVIQISHVSVAYRSYKHRPTSLKEAMLRLLRRDKRATDTTHFKALSDLSLEVMRGRVLGVIGGNGSGKSTLLKVLAQVLRPSSGSVRIRGSVASLIELGVGFDPELNAIENIYLNASLHKKSRAEISKKVDSILDFAELRDFATTPIKYYSSGMGARLGFATAIDIDPDIFLVDEIFSVGDERFQDKCRVVFDSFIKRQKTIVMVTHDMGLLTTLANEVLLLSKGESVFRGDPHKAIELYRDKSYESALHG